MLLLVHIGHGKLSHGRSDHHGRDPCSRVRLQVSLRLRTSSPCGHPSLKLARPQAVSRIPISTWDTNAHKPKRDLITWDFISIYIGRPIHHEKNML